jgi:cell division protein FtsL
MIKNEVKNYPVCVIWLFIVTIFIEALQIISIAQTCLQCNILSKLNYKIKQRHKTTYLGYIRELFQLNLISHNTVTV